MKSYRISLEIAGPTAMWTRPDTGDCPVSYPAPTYSAVEGIFSSVFWGPSTEIVPFKVEICKPLHFHSYTTNLNGPLKKKGTDGAYQFLATVLTDVCYRLHASVYPARKKSTLDEKSIAWSRKTTSPGHAHAEIFGRRLKRGQWFVMPCLGWREFTPSYVGEFRDGTTVCEGISTVVPSMLRQTFGDGYGSPETHFIYDQNVKIERGVLLYPQRGREI